MNYSTQIPSIDLFQQIKFFPLNQKLVESTLDKRRLTAWKKITLRKYPPFQAASLSYSCLKTAEEFSRNESIRALGEKIKRRETR